MTENPGVSPYIPDSQPNKEKDHDPDQNQAYNPSPGMSLDSGNKEIMITLELRPKAPAKEKKDAKGPYRGQYEKAPRIIITCKFFRYVIHLLN